MAHIERFAPSPTGFLHLGHAFSALTAWERAQNVKGQFLLRIEDIDHTRVRPEFEQAIFEDLRWLGLNWPTPVLRQSDNMATYKIALNALYDLGVTYACNCTRRDIKDAQSNPAYGPDGLVYPGTCRTKNTAPSQHTAIRLDMAKAIGYLGGHEAVNMLNFNDINEFHILNSYDLLNHCGDVILARRGMETSYHLAVVVDDAAQNITHVTRGQDLFEVTQIHRILQALLGLPTPIYYHHSLIRDSYGKRLAKSDNARAIRKYRKDGASPDDIREMVGLAKR
ncbi:MAG: tRNA glutamyl-Q(34) synthetase GluQRS [Paracoccaceae bacterium]